MTRHDPSPRLQKRLVARTTVLFRRHCLARRQRHHHDHRFGNAPPWNARGAAVAHEVAPGECVDPGGWLTWPGGRLKLTRSRLKATPRC